MHQRVVQPSEQDYFVRPDNTYFEGRMNSYQMAKFGRRKEKRSDAKLIVLAVIINTKGFLKYSDIFEGNTSDCSTLKAVITQLNLMSGQTI